MNVTFFIGNGFDLNLGLKTDYRSFYDYYIKKCPEDMLAKAISKDYKLWSDLEIGLGEYLAQIDASQVAEFLNSKALLEYHLSLYLKNQMKRLQIKNHESFVGEFKENVGNFHLGFPLVEQKAYKKFLSETAESIIYQFVSFNYTDTLDKMIKSFLAARVPIANHASKRVGYNDVIANPIHIHGDVDSIILGLNDETQINNKALQSNRDFTDCIIKKRVNDELGELRVESVIELMENSKYICVFGMSIGDTDKMWWIAIIDWLLKDSSRKLVLFVYDSSTVQSVSSQELVRLKRRKKANLIQRKNELDEAQINDLNKRIIIVKNPKLFNFRNIEIMKDATENQG